MDDAAIVTALLASEDPYMRALGSLAELKQTRGKQYNRGGIKLEDYFPFGRISYAHMCWLKAMRLRANASTISKYSPEFIDSALDLANYSIFAVMAEDARTLQGDEE